MPVMRTIPLKPIFENTHFKEAFPSVQMAVLHLIYYWSENNYQDLAINNSLRKHTYITDKSWYKHNKAIFSLFEEVSQIVLIKKTAYLRMTENARKGLAKRHAKQRADKLDKPLADNIRPNPAPIMPQLSTQAATLNKQAVISESHFKSIQNAPRPSANSPPPMLTEKPK